MPAKYVFSAICGYYVEINIFQNLKYAHRLHVNMTDSKQQMMRMDRDVMRQLRVLKAERAIPTISGVVRMLLDEDRQAKMEIPPAPMGVVRGQSVRVRVPEKEEAE